MLHSIPDLVSNEGRENLQYIKQSEAVCREVGASC